MTEQTKDEQLSAEKPSQDQEQETSEAEKSDALCAIKDDSVAGSEVDVQPRNDVDEPSGNDANVQAHNAAASMRPSLRMWNRVTLVGVLVSLAAIGGYIVTDHPHRAVLSLVATLVAGAVCRLIIPGRPWFASRGRFFDALIFVIVALAIWWLSPWTAAVNIT
ncbi:DUF3017 domain-containing protein [Schaalia suimastitidis]|uniref:DUF3017 domain-containing protein n=1 Tax=Schaalia suimastitidis TaxID=121163 RepID=UPI000424F0EC|nr:DUF3017 domain-containing protein [Schaalia suimastitidis]